MIIQNQTRLKTCKWCGKTFRVPLTREYNATKYCCKKHAQFAKLESNRVAQELYRKKYGKRLCIGTTNFKEKRFHDFEKELEAIQKEMKRLKL